MFSFPGAGPTAARSKDIPIKSLYLRGHGLQTGDVVTYRKGDGDGLVVNEEQHWNSNNTNRWTEFVCC